MSVIISGTNGIQNVLGSASAPADTNTTTPTTGVYYPSATTWGVSTAGTNALYIDASQNVGIGTTSTTGSGNLFIGGAYSSIYYNNASGNFNVGTTTNTTMSLGTNNTIRMTVDTSGNVGIGVTPGTLGSTNRLELVTPSGTASRLLWGQSGVTNYSWSIPASTDAFTLVYGASTERMRIDTSGNLLVGTTSTTSVNAGIAIIPNGSSGTTGYVRIGHSSATSGQGYLDFLYNNSIIGSVQQAGTTGVSFNTSSDYRLKENVTPMTTGLATIAALKPVNYDWISDKSAGEGFIAHELQAIIPNAVTGEKDAVNEDGSIKPQGVDYSKIVVHLVAAIQELKAEFDAYKAAHP